MMEWLFRKHIAESNQKGGLIAEIDFSQSLKVFDYFINIAPEFIEFHILNRD